MKLPDFVAIYFRDWSFSVDFPESCFPSLAENRKNHWIFSPQKVLSIYVLCCCQRLCRDCPGGKFFTSFLVKITSKVDTISRIQEYPLWSTCISLTWHPKHLERLLSLKRSLRTDTFKKQPPEVFCKNRYS